jgi:hypothetical protein
MTTTPMRTPECRSRYIDDHEVTTDADVSAFPAELSSADKSSECFILDKHFCILRFYFQQRRFEAIIRIHSPLSSRTPFKSIKPPTTRLKSSHLPYTLSPSMNQKYWLDRQWCLNSDGRFDVCTKHYSAPDTVSSTRARRCISARTLYTIASQYSNLTSRPSIVLDYVAGTDVHCAGTADRVGIELVAAWGGSPTVTVTGVRMGWGARD